MENTQFFQKRLRLPGLDPAIAATRILRSREVAVVDGQLRLGDGATLGGIAVGGGAGSGAATVTSLEALKNLDPSSNPVVFLQASGRSGLFQVKEGEPPHVDPQEGIYVLSDAQGLYYYERHWDGVQGKPEWFGAVTGDQGAAAENVTAIHACRDICSVTILECADYYVNDTIWMNRSYTALKGTILGIEGPTPSGTRIISTNPTKDIVRLGGTSPADRKFMVRVEEICAQWAVSPTAPASASDADRLNVPKAFHYLHNLAFAAKNCIAIDVHIGHAFFSNVNSSTQGCGCTRTKSLGPNDFMWGFRLYGTGAQAGFAGGNASIFLNDSNVTMVNAAVSASIDRATGIYATQDFADTFINGLETSQVNFGIRLDGAGSSFAGGHGDVHIDRVILDQLKGDGISITNLNGLAKIHIKGGYIQLISTSALGQLPSNNGLKFDGGPSFVDGSGGFITVANLQILSGAGNLSYGIYCRNMPNTIISDTVVIEGVGFPVNFEGLTVGSSIKPTIADGGNNPNGSRAAVSLTNCGQVHVAPNIRGHAGAWSEGVNLIGTINNAITIDPTRVDPSACVGGRKVVLGNNLNGSSVKISAPGYYTPAGGASGGSAVGTICVTGYVA